MTKAEFFGMLGNLRKSSTIKEQDMIFRDLADQINDPNPLRSQVLTLHLLIEYWLDKILESSGYSPSQINHLSFFEKNNELHDNRIIDDVIHGNIDIINRVRNIYGHELDLKVVEPKINHFLDRVNFSLYFHATDQTEKMLAISLQTMFQLEEKYIEIKYPGSIKILTDDDVKDKLIKEGRLNWQYCELLDKKNRPFYVTEFILKCPYCLTGKIIRYKDDTPGDKESYFDPCDNCGLDGEGSDLNLTTVKKK